MVNTVDSNEVNNMPECLVEYRECLTELGPQERDPSCGEYVGWGYYIAEYLGDRFDGLRDAARSASFAMVRLPGSDAYTQKYAVITRTLTREEAERKFGPKGEEVKGPQGGFKSIMFGRRKFTSKYLRTGFTL